LDTEKVTEDREAWAALIGADAERALRAHGRVRVFAVRRSGASGRVHGVPVGHGLDLTADEAGAVCAALLQPSTWRWDRTTRHRPLADTLIEVQSAEGLALVGLDRRGEKLGVLRDGQLHVADTAVDSAGARVLYSLAERAASVGGA
jgi:hypothetical protein